MAPLSPVTPAVSAGRPYPGEVESGDLCARWEDGSRVVLCLVDGLGHGPRARFAAEAAIASVGAHRELPIEAIFAACEEDLRITRGVAMALARVDLDARTLTWAAVGNIRGRLVGRAPRSLACDPGIVGAGYARLAPESVPFSPGDLLLLFSDGLPAELSLDPPHSRQPEDLQAWLDAIVSSSGRHNDDVAIVAERLNPIR